MSILIFIFTEFIIFVLYILFGPYTITAECTVHRSDVSLLLNLSSFLSIFGFKFTLKENRTNFEVVICRQAISLNRFIKKQKKKKKEKHVRKISKSYGTIKKFTDREQLTFIKKAFSVFDIKNSKIKLIFGSEDPYITGMVSAFVLPLLIHFNGIHFKPEFQEKSFILIAEVIVSIYVYRIIILLILAMVRTGFKDFRSHYRK